MKKSISDLLETAAARFGTKTALVGEDGWEKLSFRALSEKAKGTATALLDGAAGDRIALLCGRTPAAVALLFGVATAGKMGIPLDVGAPRERLTAVLQSAGATALAADGAHFAVGQTIAAACGIPCLRAEELTESAADGEKLRRAAAEQIDTDPLYTVFTSGSTGEPKGVTACHRSVLDYARALAETLPFDGETVFGCQSPLYLDAPLKELLSMLNVGATVCLLPRTLFSFPAALFPLMEERGVNTLCCVSSVLSLWAALGADEDIPPRFLRCILFGSETLSPVTFARWQRALPQTDFWQLYGPTEGTGMSCYWHADRELAPGEPIPIGKPFPNTGLFLLDEAGKPGESGEIYLRGSCVTMGYIGGAKGGFVQNPLRPDIPETVYRTGDLGCRNERGELVFCGRVDAQIKRMGNRIEPAEIENAARAVPGVGEAVCLGYDGGEKTRVVLFYTGTAEREQIETALAVRLPRQLLPDAVQNVPAIPRTEGGKYNRNALCGLLRRREEKGERSDG